jgi:group I intron endonuclease
MKISGIYWIKNITNDHIYIGSSCNIYSRWYWHKNSLRRNSHHSMYLQRAWNKFGEENFIFEILITCDPSMLIWYEQQFLDQWKPEYNLCKIADRQTGLKHSQEFRDAVSKRMKGHTVSIEARIKIGNGNRGNKPWTYGKHLSEETKLKISVANTGRKNTKEQVENIRRGRKGKPCPYKTWDGFISPEGVEYRNIFNLKKFCDEHDLRYANMTQVDRYEKKSHKKWIRVS